MELKMRNISFIFIFLLACSISYSQLINPVREQNKPLIIAGVSVEGNNFVAAETIISLSGLRVGDVINTINETKVQNAILNLWKRKQFHKIEIVVDRVTEQGIFLLIKVQEFPRLNEIYIKDNDKISSKDINKVIGISTTERNIY